jgi:hypothetical protein
MIFWVVAVGCFLVALWLTTCLSPQNVHDRFRKTTVCFEMALGSLLTLIVAGWKTWNLTNLSTGETMSGTSIVRGAVELFIFWSVMTFVFFTRERRR